MASDTYNSSTRKAEAGRSWVQFKTSLLYTLRTRPAWVTQCETVWFKIKKKKQEYVLSLKQSGGVFYQGALTHKTGKKVLQKKVINKIKEKSAKC